MEKAIGGIAVVVLLLMLAFRAGYSLGENSESKQFWESWHRDNPAYELLAQGCSLRSLGAMDLPPGKIVRVPEAWDCPDGSSVIIGGLFDVTELQPPRR